MHEVIVKHHQRIANLRMAVESFRHQHHGAQIHRTSPELAQQLALDFQVFDVLRVARRRDGRYFLVQQERNLRRVRADRNLLWAAVQIARRQVPVLAFAAIHGQLDREPVGTMKSFVAVQHSLYKVLPRLHVTQAADRVTEGLLADHRRLIGLKPVHVDPEDHLGIHR